MEEEGREGERKERVRRGGEDEESKEYEGVGKERLREIKERRKKR